LFAPGEIPRNQGTATSGGGASVQGRGHSSGFDEVSGDREKYSKNAMDSGEMDQPDHATTVKKNAAHSMKPLSFVAWMGGHWNYYDRCI